MFVAVNVAQGRTNDEIGDDLGISGRTVRVYVDRVKVKLGVDRRNKIARVLHEQGML